MMLDVEAIPRTRRLSNWREGLVALLCAYDYEARVAEQLAAGEVFDRAPGRATAGARSAAATSRSTAWRSTTSTARPWSRRDVSRPDPRPALLAGAPRRRPAAGAVHELQPRSP